MNNRRSKFKRFVMNVQRYGELLREIDEDDDLNGGNVLEKIERLEKQRCEHIVEWEERDFTFMAQHQNIYHGTLLHAASVACCKRAVQALLDAGANIEAKCLRGFTPLHTAAKAGQKEVVEHLLQNAANIQEVDNKGCTPLHLSAAFGSPETVTALLASGARVNATDEEQNTPLLLAVNGHEKENITKTVMILLNHKADVGARDGLGNSVLHRTILKKDNTVVLEGYLTDYEVNVVDQTAEIISLNKARNTEEVIELLLDHGAAVNVRNHAGDTPLHCAIKYSTLQVLKLLIEQGADVNARDGSLCTPLYCIHNRHALSREECYEMTKLLIENGSDINSIGAEGIATLDSIIRHGWAYLVKSIIGYCVLENPEAHMPGYIQTDTVFSYYWHTLACKVRNELNALRATNVCNNITFHDILCIKNINKLASYIQNINVLNALEERLYVKYFPMHAGKIANQYHKGVDRLKLLNAAEESVVKLFYVSTDHRVMLPYHIAREIARYLSNKDIRRLNVAAENISVQRGKRTKLITRVESTVRHA